MLNTIVVQGIGAIGFILLSLSYYKKEKKQILFMQIFAYIFFAIHYYLLNGITGAICNVIGLFALVTIYIFDNYKLKNKIPISILFIASLLAVNIMTYQNIFSLFPMVAAVIVIISFLDNNENDIRGIGVLSAICWLIYAIAYNSYISIIFEAITFINVVIAFFKNLLQKKDNKK